MPTVSRRLPDRPHIDVFKSEARELLKQCRAGNVDALDRIRRHHPRHKLSDDLTLVAIQLSDAQLVLAREYGFASWPELKTRIHANTLAGMLDVAIRGDDRETVLRVLRARPDLLHVPVVSGNWGPPMSHAANLGRLGMVELIASLGARDIQHAFDRALLQGKLDCARWLHAHGATLAPGIVMGACETLMPEGLEFLHELDAPFTNAEGNPLAPLGLALETYCRNPERKHRVLELFARRGCAFPDTPIMAFHRGDLARLEWFLRADQTLVHRRFSGIEIFPPSLGCDAGGRGGMCGTPVAGTTLLHLAIDYDEQEIFNQLLAHGADVNARAAIDADGFGGHTPLFNAVISCAYSNGRQRDAGMTRELLARGASPSARTTLCKFLDWCEAPRWHEARDVTAGEWGRTFPEQGWINAEALRLVEYAVERAGN